MLRRLKESVATGLPPKLETIVTCPLADAQVGSRSANVLTSFHLSPAGLCLALALKVPPLVRWHSPCAEITALLVPSPFAEGLEPAEAR